MSERIDKAMALFKERKYKEAIDAFSAVLETEPDNADVYNNLAVAYSCDGNFEQAENYFIKALELDPQLAQAYINLSDLYYKAGDLASAVGTLQKGSYELENNRLSYKNLFYNDENLFLCNNIASVDDELFENIENGVLYDDENDEYPEIYQYYLIDDDTATRLIKYTDELHKEYLKLISNKNKNFF